MTDYKITSFNEVEAKAVKWLWHPFIPYGKITLLAGIQGTGKSTLMAALASQVSKEADVFILAAEDDNDDTIKPRLLAAGANLDRIHTINIPSADVMRNIEIPGDTPALHKGIKEKKAKLLLIDPIISFMQESTIRAQIVRRSLQHLITIAREEELAVVAAIHLNKLEGTDPLKRIAESGAFSQVVRSVLLFGENPDDSTQRVFINCKNNLAKDGNGALYKLVPCTVRNHADTEDIATSRLDLIGMATTSPKDLLDNGVGKSLLDIAYDFLLEELDPVYEQQWKAMVDTGKREYDIAPKTLRNARDKLMREGRIANRKEEGQNGRWLWRLVAPKSDTGQEVNMGNKGKFPSPPDIDQLDQLANLSGVNGSGKLNIHF